MTNFLKSRNVYRLIVLIFLVIVFIKIRSQINTLKAYNTEIANYNEKITELENQENEENLNDGNSKKDNEDIARRDLKMYYPNETPYKGY